MVELTLLNKALILYSNREYRDTVFPAFFPGRPAGATGVFTFTVRWPELVDRAWNGNFVAHLGRAHTVLKWSEWDGMKSNPKIFSNSILKLPINS
jgi:hypothetical protein